MKELLKHTRLPVSDDDHEAGTLIGNKRQTESIRLGLIPRTDKRATSEYNRQVHISGAIAEAVFATHTGLKWLRSVNSFDKEPDVLPDFQVRSSKLDAACLIIRPRDNLNHRYVLLTQNNPDFMIFRGAFDAKMINLNRQDFERFFIDPNDRNDPAWFIPQYALKALAWEESVPESINFIEPPPNHVLNGFTQPKPVLSKTLQQVAERIRTLQATPDPEPGVVPLNDPTRKNWKNLDEIGKPDPIIYLAKDELPWVNVARKVLDNEYATADTNTLRSIIIGIRNINHPWCIEATKRLRKITYKDHTQRRE